MCLFRPLAGTVANQQSILEVMEGEKLLHVIDLGGTAQERKVTAASETEKIPQR
jgi:hypothetical protein